MNAIVLIAAPKQAVAAAPADRKGKSSQG